MHADATRRAIVRLALAAFASAAGMRLCDPLLPAIGRSFEVGTGDASVVITVFAVAYGLLQLVYGPLGDRFGKFRLVTLATAACTVTTLACAQAESLAQLSAARLAAGATSAAIIPLSLAWIGDNVPYAQRQAVIARFLFGQISGLICGQVAAGLLAESFGWRSPFVVLAAVFAGTWLLLWIEARRSKSPGTPAGADASRAVDRPPAGGMRAVLAMPWPKRVLVTVFLEGWAVFGALAFVASHLHHALGLTLAQAGLAVAVFGIGGIVYVVNVARLVGRLGEGGLVRAGGMLLAAAFVAIALAPSWPFAAAAIGLVGLGYYMIHNTLQTQATQMAPEARGASMALFASTFFLGQSLGVALYAPVVDRFGAQPAFVGSAVLLVLLGWRHARRMQARATA